MKITTFIKMLTLSGAFFIGTAPVRGQTPGAGFTLDDSTMSEASSPSDGSTTLSDDSEPVVENGYIPGGCDGYAVGCDSPGFLMEESGFPCDCGACRGRAGWVSAEYLLGWSKGRRVPALVTTSNDPLQTGNGVLGQPDTRILYGAESVGEEIGHGGRIDLGTWLDPAYEVGFGARFFGFRPDDGDFNIQSDSTRLLALPFFNARDGIEDARLIAAGGNAAVTTGSGQISIDYSAYVLSGEGYLRVNVHQARGLRFDLVSGYHYSRVADRLRIDSFSRDEDGGFLLGIGNTRRLQDAFEARNDFHGGSIGLLTQIHRQRNTFLMLGKVSLGNMHQKLTIDGAQLNQTPAGGSSFFNSGTYAVGTNIGQFDRDVLAFIPECNFTWKYNVFGNVDMSLGYSFSYWSDILTAGAAIDRQVNPEQFQGLPILVGPDRPQVTLSDSDFWVQGINFGIAWSR